LKLINPCATEQVSVTLISGVECGCHSLGAQMIDAAVRKAHHYLSGKGNIVTAYIERDLFIYLFPLAHLLKYEFFMIIHFLSIIIATIPSVHKTL
jgi:hypothetical protein